MHTLLVYLDQDEVVLVTLQPEFASRDMNGVARRLAYVDRRLQSFPHLRAADLPGHAVTLEVQPARSDCRYVAVDDAALRDLRGLEMSRSAEMALAGATANEAVKDMNAAIAAIPGFVAAEREKQRRTALQDADQAGGRGCDPFSSWSTPASLALLEESHADLSARIRAAAQVLARYAVDPTDVEHAEAGIGPLAHDDGDGSAPSGIWRRHYDRPPAG